MKHAFWCLMLGSLLGCQVDSKASSSPQKASSSPQEASAKASTADAVDAAHPQPKALSELERLDARKPVPLLPMMAHHQKQNMREHLEAVQQIVAAAARDDFPAAEAAAKRIGYSQAMGQMCEHMGAGAPGFTERALAFHHTADTIVAAAAKRDQRATLSALSETLTSCTSCHATYKQQVVDVLPH